MLGAIIGDIVGSIYEFNNIKTKEFPFFCKEDFFTDDTVLTCAVCQSLMNCKGDYSNLQREAKKCMLEFGRYYSTDKNVGFGQLFTDWLKDPLPYQSWGNGAAMRISPVAYFATSEEELKDMSKEITIVSHNHEEAIKGAEATALCVFMALGRASKDEIRKRIEKEYYKLDFDYDDLVKNYKFKFNCDDTVPQAIFCFLISNSFEDAIRNAISIGGDSDTLAAITGSIAEAFYGIPPTFQRHALKRLDKNLLSVYNEFCKNDFSRFKYVRHKDELVDFDFKEFNKSRDKFLKTNEEENFVFIKGDSNCIISVPHGVSQLRLGKVKHAEPGSLALGLEVQKRADVHLIAKTKNFNDDANFDFVSPYKDRLKKYIIANNIKYLFDLHGMKKDREIDINLGTYMGENIRADEKLFDFLCEQLDEKGFIYEIDSPFWGKANTVSAVMAKELGIWSLQMEVNCKYTNEIKNKSRLLDIIDCIIKTIEKAENIENV